ncbi:MAG: TetR/AcrR family transcriptional regulator [Nocardioides sp.]
MGRPRGFDEVEVTRRAVMLFADRTYDGVSVDDLVSQLGIHRNSLYKIFGSKRGLYLAALRHYAQHDLAALMMRIASADSLASAVRYAVARQPDEAGLDLLLLAAVERAPLESEVAAQTTAALDALDRALGMCVDNAVTNTFPDSLADGATAATVLGLRLRARITTEIANSSAPLE